MSTSGVTNGMFSQFEQVQQEFQQLGQDLTAGNLSAAQSDFANLQQLSLIHISEPTRP